MSKKAISVVFLSAVFLQFILAQNNADLFIGGEVHLDPGALVHVMGDVKLESGSSLFKNSGTLTLEGNLEKDDLSRYNSNSLGWLKFENSPANQNNNQLIDGDFTGNNAVHQMELGKSPSTGLILQNGNLEIIQQLVMSGGYIKTNPVVQGIPQQNNLDILNPAPSGLTGDLFNTFIVGKFYRNYSPNSTFILPTGTDNPAIFGPQPIEVVLQNGGPSGTLEVEFTDPGRTLIGTQALCDIGTPPDGLGTPDGIQDTMSIDCVNGRWSLSTSANNNPDFDITLYPSQSLTDQCNFRFHFLASDGVLLDECPFQDYSYQNISDFGVFDIPAVVYLNNYNLPIELVSFEAAGQHDFIDIKWISLTETNSEGYELERSLDGEIFEFLTWKTGQGNSTDQTFYHFRDLQVQKDQIYYYRLKMVDQDGSFGYSQVVSASLQNAGTFSEASIYPNPISLNNSRLYFTSLAQGELNITLFDNLGRQVFHKELEVSEGFNSITIPASISPGTYHLLLKDPNYIRRNTLIVVK